MCSVLCVICHAITAFFFLLFFNFYFCMFFFTLFSIFSIQFCFSLAVLRWFVLYRYEKCVNESNAYHIYSTRLHKNEYIIVQWKKREKENNEKKNCWHSNRTFCFIKCILCYSLYMFLARRRKDIVSYVLLLISFLRF